MSTKAIREVLGAAGFAAPDTCDEDMARKVAAAWLEVEAIEKAAVVIDDNLAAQVFASNANLVEKALDVMASIAKQFD